MKNDEKSDEIRVDGEELAAAEAGAAENTAATFTHKFKRPFSYMGKTYKELRFDWDSLTGRDGLAIEAELQALGMPVVVPALSGAYTIRMAAKACTEKIGSDAFEQMGMRDYNRIRSAARSFLLASE